jgi:phage FluMu protein Com
MAMPIKFRCKHCNQLLGIARRKAGSEVECPTCKHKVEVPSNGASEGSVVRAERSEPAVPAPPLFERSDFEEILKPPVPAERHAVPPPPSSPAPARAAALPDAYDVEPARPSGESFSGLAPPGILLTPWRATLVTVVVVLLLGVAFGAGLIVGRWVL